MVKEAEGLFAREEHRADILCKVITTLNSCSIFHVACCIFHFILAFKISHVTPLKGVMIIAPDEIRGKETAIPYFPPPRYVPF